MQPSKGMHHQVVKPLHFYCKLMYTVISSLLEFQHHWSIHLNRVLLPDRPKYNFLSICYPLSGRCLLPCPLCLGTLDGRLSACKSPRPAKPLTTSAPHSHRLLNWTSEAAWKQRKLCSLRPIISTLYTISIFVINPCFNRVLWCWKIYLLTIHRH